VANIVSDLLVRLPAEVVVYLLCLPIAFSPFIATGATWCSIVFLRDKQADGIPTRWSTAILAGVVAAYIFVVVAIALWRLPHILAYLERD